MSAHGISPKDEASKKTENRLVWLERAIVAGLIAGLLLSVKLWVSTREYPLVPFPNFIPPLPYPLDYVLLGLFGALLAGVLLFRRRLGGAFVVAVLVLAVVLVLQDQGRLQPWFYQYSFMLAAVGLFGLGRLSAEGAMNACRVIVAFTYIWSGLQKAHVSFAREAYPWLIEPLASHLPSWAVPVLGHGAYAVPVVEAAIGVGLLVRPLRKPAVVGAISMHAFILFAIGPWGHDWNSVVWPWNVAMVVFVWILFWGGPDLPSLLTVLKPDGSTFRAVVLVLFAILPALNFLGLWDSYLSASLYSNSAEEGYVYETDGSSTVATSIVAMAIEETNAPAYPEERVYKKVFAEAWCEEPSLPRPTLLVYGRPEILTGQRSETTYRCKEVREST